MSACSAQLDCLNNGGQWIGGMCALGTCSVTTTSYCGGSYPGCPAGETCQAFPGNCHSSPLTSGVVPVAGGTPRSVTRALDRHILFSQWLPDGKGLLVSASHETTAGVWIQPLDGPARRGGLGDLVLTGGFGADIEATRTGALVFIATLPNRPAELYVMDTPTSAPRRLTDFNAWATMNRRS